MTPTLGSLLSNEGGLASEGVARLLVPACAVLLWAIPAGAQSRVDIQFAATEPGVTVYSRPLPADHASRADGSVASDASVASELPAFQAVCQAPCEAALDASVRQFALAPVGRAPIPVATALELRGDARLRGEVISHASERRAGWWILGIMGTLGVTSTTIGMFQTCVDDQTCQQWTSLAIWTGFAVTAAGALIGLPKIVASDEATLTLIPGVKSLTDPAAAQLLDGARSAAIPSGLTLGARF